MKRIYQFNKAPSVATSTSAVGHMCPIIEWSCQRWHIAMLSTDIREYC